MNYIYIYIYIVQSTDTCFAVPQLISVSWYNLDMAWQLYIYIYWCISMVFKSSACLLTTIR